MQKPPRRKGNVRGQRAIFRWLAVGVVGMSRHREGKGLHPWMLFRWEWVRVWMCHPTLLAAAAVQD